MMSPGLSQIGLREYKYIHIVLQAARLEFKNESTYKADGKRQKPSLVCIIGNMWPTLFEALHTFRAKGQICFDFDNYLCNIFPVRHPSSKPVYISYISLSYIFEERLWWWLRAKPYQYSLFLDLGNLCLCFCFLLCAQPKYIVYCI